MASVATLRFWLVLTTLLERRYRVRTAAIELMATYPLPYLGVTSSLEHIWLSPLILALGWMDC
ncbi:MAG: hypothetical protein IPG48_05120 [Saprospiraceae bacterium]|nr:hypothetical protein [Saprospiraceae bacterium]